MASKEKTFSNYAAENFQSNQTVTFEKKPLQEPLHQFKTVLDKDAARAISLAIFRYTTGKNSNGACLTKPIFRKLITGLRQGSVDGNFSPTAFIQRWKTTDLETVQFICGLGILGSQLRNEIFCQIYKQINGNPSDKVRHMAWTLFACCLSSFPPTNEFYQYMISILKSAPEIERTYCKEKLERTLQNGTRSEPPSSHEHQAIILRASITVAVDLANGQFCKLTLDSASTGLEFKKQIKSARGIVDTFGFAFYVSIGKEMIVVLSGDDHVMDAISSCEQMAKKLQIPDRCRVTFFKEIFSPWHSYKTDKISTALIYNQIISSVKSGEYKIQEDSTLGNIIAVHCYLLHGTKANRKQMEEVIGTFRSSLSKRTKRDWLQLVESSFAKKFRQKTPMNRNKAAGEIVQYAKLNLIEHFSRTFQCTSSDSPSVNSSLAINSLDVRLYSGSSTPVWKILFSEVMNVTCSKLQNEKMGTVVIHTIYKDQKQIKAVKDERIHEVLNFFLTGLRKRSRYLLALHDRAQSDINKDKLEFFSGDLIVLEKDCNGETIEETGRGRGLCKRTGLVGEVSGGVFYIIPTIEAPTDSLLTSLRKSELGHKQDQMKESTDGPHARTERYDVSASGILPQTKTSIKKPSLIQPASYNNSPADQSQCQFTEQRPKAFSTRVIDPINISKKSYLELEVELQRCKMHEVSNHEGPVDGKDSLLEQEDYLGNDQQQPIPDILVPKKNASSTEKDITSGATDDLVPRHFLPVAGDQVRVVSLENDVLKKDSEVNALRCENHKEDRPTFEQERTGDASLKEIKWDPERFGFQSFEESDSYKAIIAYVHQPAGDIMSEMKLTDAIFGRPLSNSVPEEHVYREIIKQIEAGENDTCVERSWELMWLITGLYSCSDNIKDEVIGFLRARTDGDELAKQCYMRLVKMITHGRRTYPPHIAEVQAIQTRMDLINHKVFFPDGSCQSFEVESATTARHLVSEIKESIGLKYPSGCGLFFKIGDKVFGAADEYFFFDFIQHYIEVWRRTEGGDAITMNYQVFFLRKVWINIVPGEDRVADCRLHYYQELSKYLRGYHKFTESESILMATLILRAEFGEDTEHLSEIPDMLNKLVPQEMIPLKSIDEWQQVLEQALTENVTSFGDDAKIEFLKEISKRPTFGTAFFHVKGKIQGKQPKMLLLAIQKNGLALISAADMTIIEKYNFTEIEKWASGDKKITIELKVNEEKKKLEFDTSLDYQIDDFLTSYISAHGSESRQEILVSDDE